MKQALSVSVVLLLVLALFVGLIGNQGDRDYHAFDDSRKNIGIYLDELSEVKALEEAPDILQWFEHWYGEEANGKLSFCRENPSYTPFITWMPSNMSLKEIAAGEHDAYIRHFLRRIRRSCPRQDVLVRFAHEMEMRPDYGVGWYSWQVEDGARTYREAWIHVVTLAREIAPNIKWIWAPNRADEYSQPFYPGDEYVDYVGITLNHTANQRIMYRCFEDFYCLEATREELEKYGKKIIICETGYFEGDQERKARFLQSVFEYYKKDENLAAVVFFNENRSTTRQFKISDNEVYMQVFFDGIRELRKNEKME